MPDATQPSLFSDIDTSPERTPVNGDSRSRHPSIAGLNTEQDITSPRDLPADYAAANGGDGFANHGDVGIETLRAVQSDPEAMANITRTIEVQRTALENSRRNGLRIVGGTAVKGS